MDCSTPGSSVLYYLLEFIHTHVHWVNDAVQPFHPLSPTSPPVLSLSQHLLEFSQIQSFESVMLSNHLILYHVSSPFTFNLPQHWGFSSESALCITCSKYWSFSLSNSLSNKYSELISFRNDWFDLLAVQRTLKSLLQHLWYLCIP